MDHTPLQAKEERHPKEPHVCITRMCLTCASYRSIMRKYHTYYAPPQAEEERRISDTLLNSMVPRHIAGRLKELRWWEGFESVGDITIADSYPMVTGKYLLVPMGGWA